jgi:hypothetical protein
VTTTRLSLTRPAAGMPLLSTAGVKRPRERISRITVTVHPIPAA